MHISINWHCPHQDARNIKDEIILKLFKSNHLEAYKIEYGRLSGYENVIREDHQNCLFDKRETFYNKLSTRKKRWETFLVKRVTIKVFHQHEQGDSSCIFLKDGPHGLIFRGKETWSKITWNWDLSLLERFVVNMQRGTMKYESSESIW